MNKRKEVEVIVTHTGELNTKALARKLLQLADTYEIDEDGSISPRKIDTEKEKKNKG